MSNITSKFNRSNYGVIVPYQGGHYEAFVTPNDDDGSVTVAYHKAFEAMPAFESDTFPAIADADAYIMGNLSNVQLRKVRNLNPENEF